MKLFIFLSTFFSFLLFAHEKDHQHKNLNAHSHDNLKLNVTAEKKAVQFGIDGAAMGILGFEHQPKSSKEKKKWDDFLKQWKTTGAEIFSIAADFKCQQKDSDAKLITEGSENHADLEASILFECQKEIKNTKVEIRLIKNFNKIKKLIIEVLGPNGATYIKSSESIETLTL